MFQVLLIGFREGLEAFLVVAIATLYLRRFGLFTLLGALRWGVVAAVTGSALLGLLLSQIGALSPAWEGSLALLAAAAVAWCVVHMRRAGKGMVQDIALRLEQAAARNGAAAWWSVFAFTVFMVGREGVETATMIASLAGNHELRHMAVGGFMGLLIAAAIALLWVRFGHQVQLGRFFRVTAWFMALFALQLVIYALHEFTEANLVPVVDNAWWHLATEDLAEGWIAQAISLALVLVPTAWLAGAWLLDRRAQRPVSAGAR
ncbi:FTR1 family protein [Ramlibacter sp. 2FC]|uniref:FTR1 family protein n=1 Tax=Ramlibacter sp. 2FC TaxID=2502188 RepID=UPI0010F64FF1|nr:FTR1 family protein [Ramlibacter sp. 2FC]